MRGGAIAAMILLLFVAACTGDEPESSEQAKQRAGGTSSGSTRPGVPVELPPVVLESEAGSQIAQPGMECIDEGSGPGSGGCTDAEYATPRQLTVVRPGDSVRIDVPGASPAARNVLVTPLGCAWLMTDAFVLSAKESWRVDLPAGAYQAAISTPVKRGQVSGQWGSSRVGLLVAPGRSAAIISARGRHVCREPDGGVPRRRASAAAAAAEVEDPLFSIVLESAAGPQTATDPGPCLEGPDEAFCPGSEGLEGGARVVPERISVVRPGEALRIRMPHARPSQQRVVGAAPLCGGQVVHSMVLDGGEVWKVDLPRGAYRVSIWIPWFELEDGSTGTNAAEARILVDSTRPLEVLPAGAVSC